MNRSQNINPVITVLVLLFAAISIVLRVMMLGDDLPYYSVDENDVVEPALAFVAGNWDPNWYKYGPLYSYMLAAVYTCEQWFLSIFFNWTEDRFFYAAFFDVSNFYYIARAMHLLIVLIIALVSVRFCSRYYDRNTAYIIGVLSIAPVFELVTSSTIRIDTLQGLLAVISLYFAINFGRQKDFFWPYLLSGIFFGLAIACKPITGLLLLPAIIFAHFQALPHLKKETLFSLAKKHFVLNKGIYIFFLSAIIVHSLSNPFSIINFEAFFSEQISVISNKAEQAGKIDGYNFLWLFSRWGILMAIIAILSPLVILLNKDKVTSVLVFYVLTFIIVFMFFKVRMYWYNAIIPVLLILMARIVSESYRWLYEKIGGKNEKYKSNAIAIVALIIIVAPITNLWVIKSNIMSAKRADQAAQEWVENNIEYDSSILVVGRYSGTLPRLRISDAKLHAQWAEHFMYNRNKNEAWVKKYIKAHQQFLYFRQPRYKIVSIRNNYNANYGSQEIFGIPLNTLFDSLLDNVARQNNAQYVITASSTNYVGEWEHREDVEFLMAFNTNAGYRGAEVKVFRLH